jgi:hypothetical protein
MGVGGDAPKLEKLRVAVDPASNVIVADASAQHGE